MVDGKKSEAVAVIFAASQLLKEPSEPATFVQRLPNVFQTSTYNDYPGIRWAVVIQTSLVRTFGTRWVVVVQTSQVHAPSGRSS